MDKKVGEIEIYMAEEILNSFQFDPVGYKVKNSILKFTISLLASNNP